jgi:hypothetical protein
MTFLTTCLISDNGFSAKTLMSLLIASRLELLVENVLLKDLPSIFNSVTSGRTEPFLRRASNSDRTAYFSGSLCSSSRTAFECCSSTGLLLRLRRGFLSGGTATSRSKNACTDEVDRRCSSSFTASRISLAENPSSIAAMREASSDTRSFTSA